MKLMKIIPTDKYFHASAMVLMTLLVSTFSSVAASVVPATDPQPDGEVPQMSSAYLGEHPRLLLSKEEIPRLREFYQSEAGKIWKDKIEAYLGACSPPRDTKFLKDATDAQRQGLWKLPTVALHYLMTGDPQSLEHSKGFLEVFLKLPHWETTGELDSGMGAANIMIGAALAYDWIYDELDSEFREKFGAKLFYHARAMYHGGHLKKIRVNTTGRMTPPITTAGTGMQV
jgi:hypothetical protein